MNSLHKLILLLLIFNLNMYGQSQIESDILKKNKISKCKIYSYESPEDYKNKLDDSYLTDIEYYDTLGRLIKQESLEYNSLSGKNEIQEISIIEYSSFKTQKTRINSNTKDKDVTITETDSLNSFILTEAIKNGKNENKYIEYFDKNHRKIKMEFYNADNSVKSVLTYDYTIDASDKSEDMCIQNKIKKKTEKPYKFSEIITTYNNDKKITEKVFVNYYENRKQKELCQILYNNSDLDFDFHCVRFFYNSNGLIVREEYLQNNTIKKRTYNEKDLLIKFEVFIANRLVNLTLYDY